MSQKCFDSKPCLQNNWRCSMLVVSGLYVGGFGGLYVGGFGGLYVGGFGGLYVGDLVVYMLVVHEKTCSSLEVWLSCQVWRMRE